MSPIVVALGFCLVIPSILALVFVLGAGILSIALTTSVTSSLTSNSQSNALVKLEAVQGVPAGFLEFFKTNAPQARHQLDTLPADVHDQVKDIVSDYDAQRISGSVAPGAAILGSGILMVVVFVVCLPLMIVGFLLIMKKKVWRCAGCGFIFDRA